VPTNDFNVFEQYFENPKSANLTILRSPSIKTFSNFKSRCMMLRVCKYYTRKLELR